MCVVFLGPYPSLITLTRCTLYSVPHTLLFPGRLIREGATQLTYIFYPPPEKDKPTCSPSFQLIIATPSPRSKSSPETPLQFRHLHTWPACAKKSTDYPSLASKLYRLQTTPPLPFFIPAPRASQAPHQGANHACELVLLTRLRPCMALPFAGTGLGQVGSSRLSQRTGAKARRANSQQRKRAQKLEKWPPPLSARTAPVRPCTALPRPRES